MPLTKTNKLFFPAIVLLLATQFSYGQKTALFFNAYSGLFSFRGDGATTTSWINENVYASPTPFTSNPYGKKGEFSWALEVQGQRVTKNNNIYGLGIGFETLTSKVNIDTITQNGIIYYQYPADGKATLKNSFLTLNPFVGHQFSFRKIKVDLLAGVDGAFCLKSKDAGRATTTKDYVYAVTAGSNRTKPFIDWRPRVQIKTQVAKFGLLAGYSLGLTNYKPQNNLKAYTSFLRLGLSCQLK